MDTPEKKNDEEKLRNTIMKYLDDNFVRLNIEYYEPSHDDDAERQGDLLNIDKPIP